MLHHHRVKTLLGLAIDAKSRGNIDEAITLYRQATHIGRKTATTSFILRPTYSLSTYLVEQGRCREASEELQTSLDLLASKKRLAGRDSLPWRYPASQSLLGESLLCLGRPREADALLRRGLVGLEPFREKAPTVYERAKRGVSRLAELAR